MIWTSNAVMMWHRRYGERPQATTENGNFTVLLNFYVLPLHFKFDVVFLVETDFFHMLEYLSF